MLWRVYLISHHLSDLTTMSTSKIRKTRKARQDCQYTAEERNAIRMHKDEYRSQTTRVSRGHIFKTKILPDMFNYWTNNGALSLSEDEVAKRVKVSGGDDESSLSILSH